MNSLHNLNIWLKENGGGFSNLVDFCQDASGFRVLAISDIPAESSIVTCPFNLVITPQLARNVVRHLLNLEEGTDWSERQWIATYLILHSIPKFMCKGSLIHEKYLDSLPKPEQLRTPLHFTQAELDLFKGTNLYNATLDRQNEWRMEWEQCRSVFRHLDDQSFTWTQYLTAATYLSSRAFPSSIFSPTPTLIGSPSTEPILIPGVDALNHARAQPVSWSITYPAEGPRSPSQASMSLVLHSPSHSNQELFNNYGPKPNSELILGYGFSIPNNPDDTILMKIGGVEGGKWEIGRGAKGVEGLWQQVVSAVQDNPEQEPTYENLLDASSMLQDMLSSVINRLPEGCTATGKELRPDVVTMFHHYLEGQRAILDSLVAFAQSQESRAIELAREEGVQLVIEE